MITELRQYLDDLGVRNVDDYKYITWDYNGRCDVWERPPEYDEDEKQWVGGDGFMFVFENFPDLLSGEAASRRYYIVDDPDDSAYIMALMRL